MEDTTFEHQILHASDFLASDYVAMNTMSVTAVTSVLIVLRLLCVYPSASSSLQLHTNNYSKGTTKKCQKVHKTHEKFVCWVHKCQQETGGFTPLLIVDGNNVRGFGRFEWNPVELEHRVESFCHEYRIPTAVIVWDHGSNMFASMQRYRSSAESTDRKQVCVDTVTLFSGLQQRADNVILTESEFLNSFFYNNQGWRYMAFVTNDRELNFKLRQQSSSTPAEHSFQLNRKSEVKLGHESIADGKLDSDGPLFCNSCHFVELLRNVSLLENNEHSPVRWNATQAVSDAEESLFKFSITKGRRLNPRRESTWERCVIAETFRRSLCKSCGMEAGLCVPLSDEHSKDSRKVSEEFLAQLKEFRGYESPLSVGGTSQVQWTISNGPFQGPARLDKRQRRLLGSYNAFIKRE